MPIIALLTDFGMRDYYVGAMKGVILQINPQATLVDISHEISPQDVFHGAFVLRQAFPYFPVKTIFLAVVDPTVGTPRRILAARYNERTIIAPDNGLITLLHRDGNLEEIRIVENRHLFAASPAHTFQGRDIMAPIAAYLSKNDSMEYLGPLADHVELLDLARPTIHSDGTIDGQVILIDHFGNLITNISAMDLGGRGASWMTRHALIGPHDLGPIRATYADAPEGHPLALIGSAALLEIAINGGHAARQLKMERGSTVQLRCMQRPRIQKES
ncbi:MAG: SAM-dependent chlorinase/fluorinase [Phycisphaerales bacterium]|nr:SAM-dependent chlorinase/fluorinase [Phycisphaerales bacterium]